MQLVSISTVYLYRLATLPNLVSQRLIRLFDMLKRLRNAVLLTGQLNKLEASAWVAERHTTRDVVITEEALQLQASSVGPCGYFKAVGECSS